MNVSLCTIGRPMLICLALCLLGAGCADVNEPKSTGTSMEREHNADTDLGKIQAALTLEQKVDLLRTQVTMFGFQLAEAMSSQVGMSEALEDLANTTSLMVDDIDGLSDQVALLQQQVGAAQANAPAILKDANGQVLGQLMGFTWGEHCYQLAEPGYPAPEKCDKYNVYVKGLNRMLTFQDLDGGITGAVFYALDNCAGLPYIQSGVAYDSGKNQLVMRNVAKDVKQMGVKSHRSNGAACAPLGMSGQFSEGQYIPVAPFTLPIALPLKVE